MKKVIIYIFFIWNYNCYAQNNFYQSIALGQYTVGFCDTILFDESITYNEFGYHGAAPLFVQIWHPVNKIKNPNYLQFSEFRNRHLPKNLEKVYHEINKELDKSFIEYNLSESLIDGESIEYIGLKYNNILDSIKQLDTKSVNVKIKNKNNYPIIIFHHGSQAASDDNYILAEYFASRGYIVLASNFHLPYPNTPFGLLPYELEKQNKHNQSAAKKLIQFSKSITKSKELFFIGHSWGAQEGWCFLHEPGWASAFVSMETTIEFKSDSNEIKEKWPYVYQVVKTENKTYSLPILLFANTQKNEGFNFFENKHNTSMTFISSKANFNHDSYNASYLMRYYLNNKIKQPDKIVLKEQIELYGIHLKIMEDFFISVKNKKVFNKNKYESLFYIN